MNTSIQKPTLRKSLRAARRALAPAERARSALRAARAVGRLPAFRSGARISVYLPFDAELDTAALIAMGRARGVRLYVPVVMSRRHRTLRFCPLTGITRSGTFGIRVPHRQKRPVAPRWLNLMIIPLVGVDTDGRRLGMGGGFYDRALAFRRQRRHWRGPLLVGFAYDFQRVPTVYAQPWDLTLDVLVSDKCAHAQLFNALAHSDGVADCQCAHAQLLRGRCDPGSDSSG